MMRKQYVFGPVFGVAIVAQAVVFVCLILVCPQPGCLVIASAAESAPELGGSVYADPDDVMLLLHSDYAHGSTNRRSKREQASDKLNNLNDDKRYVTPLQPLPPTTTEVIKLVKDANSSEDSERSDISLKVKPSVSENNEKLSDKSDVVARNFDLSDVSMDNDDGNSFRPEEHHKGGDHEHDLEKMSKILVPATEKKNNFSSRVSGICEKGGLTYENGEKLEFDCDSICTCVNGVMDCKDRCIQPKIKKGFRSTDALCHEKATDDSCCSVLVCVTDTETEPLELCSYKNKTYERGEIIKEGCSEICTCEASGKLSCKPRCPPIQKSSDKCLEITDTGDACCKKLYCDVSLEENKDTPGVMSAKFVNSTTIRLEFDMKNQTQTFIDLSQDKSAWKTYNILPGGYITNIDSSKVKYLRVNANIDDVIEIQPMSSTKEEKKGTLGYCEYKNTKRHIGEEFNDSCDAFCVCKPSGVKCWKLECPTYFGLDLLDPNCIKWDTVPANFTPVPPKCCPDRLECKNNGSCVYEKEIYHNWQQIPVNVTGCQKRCYCEMGKVECQNVCAPVPAVPPRDLSCPANQAMLSHLPGDDCCMYWMCDPAKAPANTGSNSGNQFNSNLGPYNGVYSHNLDDYQPQTHPQNDIVVHTLEAIDAHTVRLAFNVPAIIVGLHGRVEVRYTYKKSDDVNTWELQVFAPPNDLIATSQLEFDLVDLKPNTEYRIKITITLRDLHNTPSSRIYAIRTLRETAVSTLPPMIPIEPNLIVTDTNATWVNVAWRKFSDYELQFIDGVQLRFKEIDGKIYAATPLIHRAITSYTVENLKPNTKYEVGIFFIPFPEQSTELQAERMVQFTTSGIVDKYAFNVTLEIALIKVSSVEIAWSGVPYPQDKYVNIYRAIYQSDTGKDDFSTFKIAKRDSAPHTVIHDLKPGTRYRLWLEVYLTNGRIKTSNVQDFITKPRSSPQIDSSYKSDKVSGAKLVNDSNGNKADYYGPLIIVAILATIAIFSTLVLLFILLRRHGQNKAAITPPSRVSQSAYDNPTYKVEIQQETMS